MSGTLAGTRQDGGARSVRRRLLRPERMAALAALPLLAFLFVQFFWPVGLLLGLSVTDPSPGLQHFQRMLDRPVYVKVLGNTFELAATVTMVTVAAGYPVAFAMTRVGAAARDLLLFLILVPFWTSVLVRTYGWMVLLGREGMVNGTLRATGLTDRPIQLLFNGTVVRLAMVQILLPFFVLPLYSVMRTIDPSLLQAAEGLGAPPVRAFRRVYLPLSMPGVAAGALIVFVLSFGFFVTPALLGGRTDMTIAMLIFQQFDALLNWGFGAALSTALVAATLLVLAIFARVSRGAVRGAR